MADAKQHTFMILTKRSQRMKRLMKKWHGEGRQFGSRGCLLPLPNVWLGVSIEDQEAAYRIDFLTRTPAAVRFLSCEPLIGGLDLTPWLFPANIGQFDPDGQLMATPARSLVDWVIAGGESGPGARPMHPDWARSLRDQCVSAGIPYYFKQWGEWLEVDGPRCQRLNQAASRIGVWMLSDGTVIPRGEERGRYFTPYSTSIMARVGKHKAGRELDGRTWDEFPGVMVG
jgi:protein gp37